MSDMKWWARASSRLGATRLGVMSGRRAKVDRLPFNRELEAYNVYEMPLDPTVIATARALYALHVAPRWTAPEGSLQSGDLALFVKRPAGWSSDIGWWSADDAATYHLFEAELFQKVRLDEPFRRLVDLDQTLRLYCPFFVVRSRCERTRFHKDYDWGCRTNAYTLMTPLEDLSATRDGHLAYLDSWGRQRIYRYRLGVAVVFGAGFLHGTQPVVAGAPRAFLCFTFGSDKEQYWPAVRKSIGGQSRLICRPGGELVRDSQPIGASSMTGAM
jgi:hypothetical protein